jgi:hypothetical protein
MAASCLGAFVLGFCGCATAKDAVDTSEAALTKKADDKYKADHKRCVEKFSTRPEIEACREAVRWQWGIESTPTKDAGRD